MKNPTLLTPATTVAGVNQASHYFSTTTKEESLQSKGAGTFSGTLAQGRSGASHKSFAFSASDSGSKPAVAFPYTVMEK